VFCTERSCMPNSGAARTPGSGAQRGGELTITLCRRSRTSAISSSSFCSTVPFTQLCPNGHLNTPPRRISRRKGHRSRPRNGIFWSCAPTPLRLHRIGDVP